MTLKHRKPVIGIIGGIGAGKSTVARMFQKLGCAVIDADALAREVLQEPAVAAELARWWGPDVLDEQGQVRRDVVARKVFSDEQELRRLEALVHPQVHARRHELRKRYEADPAVVAIIEDCPLLLERGLQGECDRVLMVRASRENRLKRLERRGWDAAELDRRESRQLSLDIKAQSADDVLDNDAGEEVVFEHVRRVLSAILQVDKQIRAEDGR